MRRFLPSSIDRLTLPFWLGPAVLVMLLGVLASLQVRWLDEVREADRERTRARLETDTKRFAADFNGELTRLALEMQPLRRGADEAGEALADAWRRWRETADEPDLLAGIYVHFPRTPSLATAPSTSAEPFLLRLDPEAATLEPVPAEARPEALRRVEETLAHARRWRPGRRSGPPRPGRALDRDPQRDPEPPARFLVPEAPAVLLPYFGPPPVPSPPAAPSPPGAPPAPDAPSAPEASPTDRQDAAPWDERRNERRGERRAGSAPPAPEGRPVLVLLLDRDVLFDTWLPELVRRHFGPSPSFHLRVLPMDSPSTTEPLFAAGPEVSADATIDATAPLFGPLRFTGSDRALGPRPRRLLGALSALGGLDQGAWRLEAIHPAGSLDAAVDRARSRNLAVVFAILAILAASVLLLAANARRTRALALRQLEFVAGVTHELRTPLAALRSAGQNLADGVVAEPAQVRRYGQLVDREAARLSDLVAQVLAFARVQSGAANPEPEGVDPASVAESVIEAHRPTFDSEGIVLDVDLDENLPPVAVDRQAFERILSNLLSNAAKYGQGDGEGWIGLEIRHEPREASRSGGFVVITVRDRGPGLDPRDRRRLFEPFVRGRGLAASAVPGSGLGLALVRQSAEAHGGRVHVESSPGEGATFTVTLPVASKAGRNEDRDENGERR